LAFNPPTRQVKEQMLLELLGPFEHPVANLSEELSKWFEDFLFDRFASAESLPSLELRERICQQVQLLGFIQFCGRCIFATDPDPVRSLQYIRFATSFRSIYKLPPLCETLYQVAHANFATVVLTKMENEMTEAQSKELKDSFRFLQISGRHLPGVHPEAPRVNLQARIPQIWKDAKKNSQTRETIPQLTSGTSLETSLERNIQQSSQPFQGRLFYLGGDGKTMVDRATGLRHSLVPIQGTDLGCFIPVPPPPHAPSPPAPFNMRTPPPVDQLKDVPPEFCQCPPASPPHLVMAATQVPGNT